MNIEYWKFIPGFEGLYLISNYGRIMALDYYRRGVCKILSLSSKHRYLKVTLRDRHGMMQTFWVHRLVALTFIPNPEGKPEVDHIDGNKFNNAVTNLRWVDGIQNCNNPNTIANRRIRYHKPGEWQRRSNGQKKRFARPEERAKLLAISARGRAVLIQNRTNTSKQAIINN